MAIKQCRECGRDVSTQAKSCPHCGAVRPVKHSSLPGLLVLGVVLAIVFWAQGGSSPDHSGGGASANADLSDEECMQDIQCWRDRVYPRAKYDCREGVESLAEYSFRWTDGLLESRFSHMRWVDQEAGTIAFVGDKVEFQNGFGAYQVHTYECRYDPISDSIIDVLVWPGRLK